MVGIGLQPARSRGVVDDGWRSIGGGAVVVLGKWPRWSCGVDWGNEVYGCSLGVE